MRRALVNHAVARKRQSGAARVERLHHIVNWFDIYLTGERSNEYDLVPSVEPEWERSK